MPSNIEFIVNSRIEIEMENEYYKSNIQDVGKDYIGISIPINNGKYLTLHRGDKIKCIYFCNSRIYSFITEVVSRKIDRIFIIVIKKPAEFKEDQRRNFARVPFISDILCEVLPVKNDIGFFNAVSLNISGGGIKISVDMKLDNEIKYGFTLMIVIPVDNENIIIKGKVVRIDKNNENRKLICGISFFDMEKNTREKLIKLVFKIMRSQIRKGVKGE